MTDDTDTRERTIANGHCPECDTFTLERREELPVCTVCEWTGWPMTTYSMQVEQRFLCTYDVEADSPEEAVEKLFDYSYNAECVHQVPDDIITLPADVEPEELP